MFLLLYFADEPPTQIAAPGHAKTTITPVTKFWIAADSSTIGKTMNTSSASNISAFIDFTANPGMYAANVTQEPTGAFTVKFFPHAAAAAISRSAPLKDTSSPLLQLKSYMSV